MSHQTCDVMHVKSMSNIRHSTSKCCTAEAWVSSTTRWQHSPVYDRRNHSSKVLTGYAVWIPTRHILQQKRNPSPAPKDWGWGCLVRSCQGNSGAVSAVASCHRWGMIGPTAASPWWFHEHQDMKDRHAPSRCTCIVTRQHPHNLCETPQAAGLDQSWLIPASC